MAGIAVGNDNFSVTPSHQVNIFFVVSGNHRMTTFVK